MEQPTSRRRRIRRTAAIGTVTALAAAALATASVTLHGPVPAVPGTGVPDPGARMLAETVDAGGLAACRIRAESGVQMSEGIPTPPGYVRSTGVVRALNLMIDFPDAPGEGPAMRRFAEFFPQTADWFRVSSYGRLRYVPYAPVPTWLRMPLPFPEYGVDRGAPYEPGYRKLVEHIVEAADEHVDFSTYDLVNVLVTPNAGPSALETVLSVTFSGNTEAPGADGVTLSNTSFVYSRQDDGSGSFHRTGYRVLPHENGHVFGLPDLYTAEGGAAVGHWDIMSEDWGANNDLLGWHKWKLGWLDDHQVRCASERGTREYTLTPLARSGGVKLAVVPLSDLDGYALEVRTREGNDEAVCDPGVLIYRVRTDVDTGQGPVIVEDGERDSGGCTRRPNVHAELSDAPYGPGETFRDEAAGVAVTILSRERNGTYRIRLTRR
ncbi:MULTISPECIES: M6 family metalloprotease domain-containing protein [Streptomyces]|uniref:M6 family metalloprotease domain-containing protein n=1 Tax=Streptomyces sudanensis TaxID=436397 RepID=A0ABY4TE00_9ACTN|nr:MULTISPECIES: M6 family metalloprotease domain-containing protein [Streptomyces]MCP9958582.1 M6 family metalloprotease domain-containing protein [Streptomyces sudanensis]MCQ0000911.1 M6 family metalloprotease domain-containing protein [Streptomyces sudanensis]URN16498.1 M6 family metalloprotease domain-containing protein [Streptomyces sudanensis]